MSDCSVSVESKIGTKTLNIHNKFHLSSKLLSKVWMKTVYLNQNKTFVINKISNITYIDFKPSFIYEKWEHC